MKFALLFGAYFITAKLGLRLAAVSGFATLVWPPSGIALAALLLWGENLWPAVFAAAFLTNLTSGAPFLSAVGIGIGNTLEPFIGAYLLKRIPDLSPRLERMRDVLGLVFLAAFLSTIVSATLGVASLWLAGVVSSKNIGITWKSWWVGDALGDLTVAPLILTWATFRRFQFSLLRCLEGFLLLVLLVLTSLITFHGFTDLSVKPYSLSYLEFPVIIWAALRFGPVGTVTALAIVSALTIWGTVRGLGPFANAELSRDLLFLQTFQAILVTTGMVLASAVTERRKLYGEARKAIQARDEFLSIASHELKTPLTTLSLQTQLRLKQATKEGAQTFPLEVVQQMLVNEAKQLDRLTRLVNEMSDITRLHAGKMEIHLESVDLRALVTEVIQRFSNQLQDEGYSILLDAKNPVIGEWDRHRVEQIFTNLLTNAMKYGNHRPIEVTIGEQGPWARLALKDHGIGIAEKDQKRIFEQFERAAAESASGLGLGLYIVRKIVETHGGSIHIQSVLGEGSTFTVKLPLKAPKL